MNWIVEPELQVYADHVLPWLVLDPVTNTVPCTVLLTRLAHADPDAEPPWLAWFESTTGELSGLALRTPPHGLLVSGLPGDALGPLADLVQRQYDSLPAVVGPPGTAEAVVAAWSARTGQHPRRVVRQHLYRLDAVLPPAAVPGRLRVADARDVPVLTGWLAAFVAETGLARVDAAQAAHMHAGSGRALLWEDAGARVCLVGHTVPAAGVPRVGPVYTPPEHRRRGYAAAATAAVCQRLLTAGADACVLFADQANPTANGVYRRIGFRLTGGTEEWVLGASPETRY